MAALKFLNYPVITPVFPFLKSLRLP